MNIQEEYQQETGLYHYDSGSMDFKWSDDYVEWLEKRVEVLTLTDISQQRELLMATLTSRVLTIQNEPDGIVRETMINNLLIDITQ